MEVMVTILGILLAWFLLSIPLGLLVGQFIAWGAEDGAALPSCPHSRPDIHADLCDENRVGAASTWAVMSQNP